MLSINANKTAQVNVKTITCILTSLVKAARLLAARTAALNWNFKKKINKYIQISKNMI